MIKNLVAILSSEVGLSTEDIADVLWLASIRQRHLKSPDNHSDISDFAAPQNDNFNTLIDLPSTFLVDTPITNKYLLKPPVEVKKSFQSGIFSTKAESQNIRYQLDLFNKPFRFPGASAFREPLPFMKALLPLLKGRKKQNSFDLDEVATINKILNENIWTPVFKEVSEPWLDLAFVVEESVSMLIWQQTILELRHFLKNYGLFRDVRTWGLLTDDRGLVRVRSGFGKEVNSRNLNNPRELFDPEGRRLILLISDCISPIWHTGQILPTLDQWSSHGPMALLQMLPEWLWDRTALRQASSVFLKGFEPGISNQRLTVLRRFDELNSGETTVTASQIKMPVLTLEPKMALAWSRMISGQGGVLAPGFLFNNISSSKQDEENSEKLCGIVELAKVLTAKERVEQFWLVASSTAWNLLGLLAASPTISLPVVRLIQETLLPESRQVHVAEVMLGGLLKPTEGKSIRAETDPDAVTYQFIDPEIRSLLLKSSSVKDTVSVLSNYIERHFGRSLDSFLGYLRDLDNNENTLEDSVQPFAMVASEVLSRQGSRYAEFVQAVERKYGSHFNKLQEVSLNYPELETLKFDTAKLLEAEAESPLPLVEPFTFKVATLVKSGRTWKIQKSDGRANRYLEQIDKNTTLEMVGIAGGKFMMGSPAREPERYGDESPQHLVRVPDFYLGRYPVTQAQWRSIAIMPPVDRKLDPDPSRFKGDTRPVERVSWEDAIEFCARLSKHTQRQYRLPTEAEWEYACRAGTTTPFHFGKNISPELANYDGSAYENGPIGKSHNETTPVDYFEIANAWGLCDMHGNVWEWCEDHWHNKYKGAPVDGNAWLTDDPDAPRVFRGGSWIDNPWNCRSAYRYYYNPSDRSDSLGLRMAVGAPGLF